MTLDQRTRSAIAAARVMVEDVDVPDPRRVVRRGSRRRRMRGLAGALTFAVAVVGVALWVTVDEGNDEAPTIVAEPSAELPSGAPATAVLATAAGVSHLNLATGEVRAVLTGGEERTSAVVPLGDDTAAIYVAGRAYLLGAHGATRDLGAAVGIRASARAGRVWVISPAGVTEVSSQGDVVTPSIPLPAGYVGPFADTTAGLVLRDPAGSSALYTWDPRTPQQAPVRTVESGVFIAAEGNLVAYAPPPDQHVGLGAGRPLRLLNLTSGSTASVEFDTPPLAGLGEAALSPDGTRLAVVLANDRYETDQSNPIDRSFGSVVIIDTRSGAYAPVPSGDVGIEPIGPLTWSSDGRYLLFTVGIAAERDDPRGNQATAMPGSVALYSLPDDSTIPIRAAMPPGVRMLALGSFSPP